MKHNNNYTDIHRESSMMLSELKWAHDYYSSGHGAIDDDDSTKSERILAVNNNQLLYAKEICDKRFLIDSKICNGRESPVNLQRLSLNTNSNIEDQLVVQKASIFSRELKSNSPRSYVFFENIDENSDIFGNIGVLEHKFSRQIGSQHKRANKLLSHVFFPETKLLGRAALSKIINLLPSYEIVV